MLAARRGDTDQALNELAEAHAQPLDGWHQTVLDATDADVHRALGNWAEAADAAERGWESASTTSALWAARFAMLSVAATVERTLDERARLEPIDLNLTIARLQARIDAARSFAELGSRSLQRDAAAHLAHATASVTRLTGSDADAWAEAAARWADLGDRWATAGASLREAEAAALVGSADRAASALRQAHAVAVRTRCSHIAGRDRRRVTPNTNQHRSPHPHGARCQFCAAARTHTQRSRSPDSGCCRAHQPPDRRRALRFGQDRQRPRLEHPAKAWSQDPSRRRRSCPTSRHGLTEPVAI